MLILVGGALDKRRRRPILAYGGEICIIPAAKTHTVQTFGKLNLREYAKKILAENKDIYT